MINSIPNNITNAQCSTNNINNNDYLLYIYNVSNIHNILTPVLLNIVCNITSPPTDFPTISLTLY